MSTASTRGWVAESDTDASRIRARILGYRVRRAGYLKRAEVTEQTATRDLAALASAGILTAYGNGRGRYYAAGEPIKQIQERRRATRKPLRDPYPWMRAKLGEPTA